MIDASGGCVAGGGVRKGLGLLWSRWCCWLVLTAAPGTFRARLLPCQLSAVHAADDGCEVRRFRQGRRGRARRVGLLCFCAVPEAVSRSTDVDQAATHCTPNVVARHHPGEAGSWLWLYDHRSTLTPSGSGTPRISGTHTGSIRQGWSSGAHRRCPGRRGCSLFGRVRRLRYLVGYLVMLDAPDLVLVDL